MQSIQGIVFLVRSRHSAATMTLLLIPAPFSPGWTSLSENFGPAFSRAGIFTSCLRPRLSPTRSLPTCAHPLGCALRHDASPRGERKIPEDHGATADLPRVLDHLERARAASTALSAAFTHSQ